MNVPFQLLACTDGGKVLGGRQKHELCQASKKEAGQGLASRHENAGQNAVKSANKLFENEADANHLGIRVTN